MTPEAWHQVKELFRSALEHEVEERPAFLDRACAGNVGLLREVQSLLASFEESDSIIQTPVAEAAAQLFMRDEAESLVGQQLGHYETIALLGEGGMGAVYLARDTKLGRKVALKLLPSYFTSDGDRLRRFEQEACAASSLNHPNILTIYEIGETNGTHFIATEFIEGETLRECMKRGPAEIGQVLHVAEQVASALAAAHEAGIVHRDIKPENIMVRPDALVKVLDFGLAKLTNQQATSPEATTRALVKTSSGVVMGTVPYMSPEQALGREVDHRSDLFSLGVLLYEMATGQSPFAGGSVAETLDRILHAQPEAMASLNPQVPAHLEGVVRKCLEKDRERRYQSGRELLVDLKNPRRDLEVGASATARESNRALTRLIVLPFRILRQHETSDFLSISLPDAITSSLAAVDSLVVRSTMTASRFTDSPSLDIKAVAEQAQVDAILTGTILSDGEKLRVNTQLVEARSGAVLWSNTSQVSVRDIFQLQDELVDRIVDSLALPLSTGEQRALKHDVPASATAYEWYLRANQIAAGGGVANMIKARDLYLRCVDLDSNYGPAWARLGRAYRILGKFDPGDDCGNFTRADEAFKKAFTLNPELALAHNFYTVLESDLGRSLDSVERLLKRAHTHRNDPNLFAGLVQACRYCDLLPASVAANQRARQLDPLVPTSVAWTYLSLGNFQAVLDSSGAWDGLAWVPAMIGLGRRAEAIERLRELEISGPGKEKIPYAVMWRVYLEGDLKSAVAALDRATDLVPIYKRDPEARFIFAQVLAMLREPDRALDYLSLALDEGYRCHYALVHHREWDSLRNHPQFTMLTDRAAEMSHYAQTLFLHNGGNRLLGVPRST